MLNRREFITLLGCVAAAWPVPAGAQVTIPAIGFLRSSSLADFARILPPFRRGLESTGYVEHQNVLIEHRWADGRYERLPALAEELVRRQVALIVALSDPAALAAKSATSTIPIVFSTGTDPVELGLVPSLSRPGGNLTGLSQLNNALGSKRLELMRELVPNATSIAFLVNPVNPNTLANIKDIRGAADSLGAQLHVLRANSEEEFETAFDAAVRLRVEAILVASDPYFLDRRGPLVALAARHASPRRRGDRVRRREFITLLGGAAAAWPFTARAQQPAMPVIGFLTARTPGEDEHLLAAFHHGLKEAGMLRART
jgi:putative ABC transport system substrate-binding protein